MNTLEINYRTETDTLTPCVDSEYPICFSSEKFNVGFKKDFTDPHHKSLIFRFEKRTGIKKQGSVTRSQATTIYLCTCQVTTEGTPTITCIGAKNQKKRFSRPTTKLYTPETNDRENLPHIHRSHSGRVEERTPCKNR